ncbi:MAG: hypothetical protein ACTMIR_07820 [Cellulomonadaceae bacterium]
MNTPETETEAAPRIAGDVPCRDRGAAGVEHVGVVAIVLVLVGALVGLSSPVGQTIAAEICKAVGTTCGAPEQIEAENTVPQDSDYQPPACMFREESQSYSTSMTVWFVKIGQDSGFIVQEYADGTVRVTVTDGLNVGAEGEVGSKTFDAGKLGDGDNAGVDVSLGADLTLGYGDTWEFEDMDEWDAAKEQLDTYLMQQEMLKQQGGVFAIKGMGGFVDPPKETTISFTEVGLEAGLDASIGLREPTGKTDTKGNPEFLDPNLGANLSVTAGTKVTVEKNKGTGETSWTYEVSGAGEAGVDLVGGGGSVQGKAEGAFTVTRDGEGKVTEVVFKTMHEGGAEGYLGNDTFSTNGSASTSESTSTVTTTRLEVDDTNRELVDEWLGARGDYGEALKLPFGAMVPDKPSSDPFMQLMYEESTMSVVQYHNVRDKTEFEAAIKKGWKFGFSVSAENATATAVDADFLGAAGPDGVRVMVPDSVCVS